MAAWAEEKASAVSEEPRILVCFVNIVTGVDLTGLRDDEKVIPHAMTFLMMLCPAEGDPSSGIDSFGPILLGFVGG